MVLSVSAFPEHVQARHSPEVQLPPGDNGSKSVAAAPRILSMFSTASPAPSAKKPESQPSSSLVKDDEPDVLTFSVSNTFSPSSSHFSPSQDYERAIHLDEQGGSPWGQFSSKRHQHSPFARKASPSPSRLGGTSPSNRLELGAVSRALPLPTHIPSKSSPSLSHITQNWGLCDQLSSGPGQTLSPSRPLPMASNPSSDPFKSALSSSPSSGYITSMKTTNPIVIPSRSASAFSGSSKYTNANSSPKNYSNSILTPPWHPSTSNKALSPSPAPPITLPPSKVLITHPPRNHKTSLSLSMQYQSLTVDLPSPTMPTPNSLLGMSVERPRTSPDSISGIGSTSDNSSTNPRTAFENIPASWTSKPSDLSSSRPSSPPSSSLTLIRPTAAPYHHRPYSKGLRARSLSRPRRDRSDSHPRLTSGTSRTPLHSAGPTNSFTGGFNKVGRYGPQSSTGVSSFGKRPNAMPIILGRPQGRIRTISASNSQIAVLLSSSLPKSPTSRDVRAQSPSVGPVMRTKSMNENSLSPLNASRCSQTLSVPNISSSPTDPRRLHPIIISAGVGQTSDAISPPPSPLESFIDGPENDSTSLDCSPSPIEYALPPDDDKSSDWDSPNDAETSDDDFGGVSSSTSNSRGVPKNRRRTQLRSYKMEYRPHTYDPPCHDSDGNWSIEFSSSPDGGDRTMLKSLRVLPPASDFVANDKKKGVEGRRKKEKWTFGDFTSIGPLSSPSTPGTRAASPERKGRSRQPRRLAEAVSLALGSRRGSVSNPSHGTENLSGQYQTFLYSHSGVHSSDSDVFEVLDIRMPSLDGSEPRRNSSSDIRIPDFSDSSATPIIERMGRRSEDNEPWVTKEGKRSGRRDATRVESRIIFRNSLDDGDESEDMPFMYKPPENPIPFIPPRRPSIHTEGFEFDKSAGSTSRPVNDLDDGRNSAGEGSPIDTKTPTMERGENISRMGPSTWGPYGKS